MPEDWTLQKIENLIHEQVEESTVLEYKGSKALGKNDDKRTEITRDISAMANSAGGVIIYGIREFEAKEKRHLPEKLDPINRAEFSKEWLEHVIGNIKPRIDGLKITPLTVPGDSTTGFYVVEVPQGRTAHQCMDLRYYSRRNFECTPMFDHEVRDVMGRNSYPDIVLEFAIVRETRYPDPPFSFGKGQGGYDEIALQIYARNNGSMYAKYIVGFVSFPRRILFFPLAGQIPHGEIEKITVENTVRELVNYKSREYGPARYDPILPSLSLKLRERTLVPNFANLDLSNDIIQWSVHADNAPPKEGVVRFAEISIVDQRNKI